MTVSCLVRLSGVKCLADVIPLMSAFGLVITVTLKELSRLQLILSAKPLAWLFPSYSRLCLVLVCVAYRLSVFDFLSLGNGFLWFEVAFETFLGIRPFIIVGIVYVSFVPFVLYCRTVILSFWGLSRISAPFVVSQYLNPLAYHVSYLSSACCL